MNDSLKNRNNLPVIVFGILIFLFLIGFVFSYADTNILAKMNGPEIIDLIFNGGDEYIKAIYPEGLGKIRFGLFLFWLAIIANYIGIVVFYREIHAKEENKKNKLIIIFLAIAMPYLTLISIWYLQSDAYIEYHQTKQKLVSLSKQNLIDETELKSKIQELDEIYYRKSVNEKENKTAEVNEDIKNKNYQKLKDLKDAGILSDEEFESKIKNI